MTHEALAREAARAHRAYRAECTARVRPIREALGLPPPAAQAAFHEISDAWLDLSDHHLARSRHRLLQYELVTAATMYGFPAWLVDVEKHRAALQTLAEGGATPPDRSAALHTAISFGEDLRDHLAQIIDYLHETVPADILFSMAEFRATTLRKDFLEHVFHEELQRLPPLKRIFRQGGELDEAIGLETRARQDMDQAVQRLIIGDEQKLLGNILHKGLGVLTSRKDYQSLLTGYI